MSEFTMGSLFAGIGGFDLGFERAGFRTKWQVEIDPFATKVLAKNFPYAQRFGDIKECCGKDCGDPGRWRDGDGCCDKRFHLKPVDVICGGFPCQDISNAGKRAGIEGARSGLVTEGIRVIRELRPRFVLLENVAALLTRGLGEVLGYLAEIGYDATWEIVSAADAGAPHLRQRIWILAYPKVSCGIEPQTEANAGPDGRPRGHGLVSSSTLADDPGSRRREGRPRGSDPGCARESEQPLSVANAARVQQGWKIERPQWERAGEGGESIAAADADIHAQERPEATRGECGNWEPEPNVGRVAHGIPARVDRLRCLGNAVVPQIPELFARRIRAALESER